MVFSVLLLVSLGSVESVQQLSVRRSPAQPPSLLQSHSALARGTETPTTASNDAEKKPDASSLATKDEAKGLTGNNASTAAQHTVQDIKLNSELAVATTNGTTTIMETQIRTATDAQASSVEAIKTSAYGQLADLKTEFEKLKEDDDVHIHKLLFNVKLRDRLRKKFLQEQETLRADDELLTMQIIDTVKETHHGNLTAEDLQKLGLNDTHTTTASLLATSIDEGKMNPEDAERAKGAMASLVTLDAQIAQVRAKDQEEIHALESNAKHREKLRSLIEKQEEQLSLDATSLLDSLDSVEQLAGGPKALEKKKDEASTATVTATAEATTATAEVSSEATAVEATEEKAAASPVKAEEEQAAPIAEQDY